MPALFPDLRKQLLAYKNANPDVRKEMLKKAHDLVDAIKDVKDKKAAAKAYKTMSYAATLIAYANSLHNIDHKEYFSILADFKMPKMFDKVEKINNEDVKPFEELKEYFEFHATAPKMRLLKPVAEIPNRIWKLFRDAQKQHVKDTGVKGTFNLDDLDIDNPPTDALYPIRIQFLGKLRNRAVDCISPTFTSTTMQIKVNGALKEIDVPAGAFKLANKFGRKLLPGGGMQEITNKAARHVFLEKVLDEHLEEERGNLHELAKDYYDNGIDLKQAKNYLGKDYSAKTDKDPKAIANKAFDKALQDVYTKYVSKAKTVSNGDAFFAGLQKMIQADGYATNSGKLAELIAFVDDVAPKIILPADKGTTEVEKAAFKKLEAEKAAQEKTINELRAALQVQPFRLTALYQEAFKFLDKHAVIKQVEQFCDERQGGGFQISDVAFINCEPSLFDWFNQKEGFKGQHSEPGDDLRGTNPSYETLLQALAGHEKMNFSHLLIMLESQLDCFKNGKLKFEKDSWDHDIEAAKDALKTSAEGISAKVEAACAYEKATYERALQGLEEKNKQSARSKKKEVKLLHSLVKDLHKELKSSENKVDYNTLRVMAENTTRLLDKDMTREEFKAFAKECLLGRPENKRLKVLAGILGAIAVAAVILGAVAIATPVGVGLLAGGAAGLLAATGMFAKGRSSGFRRELAEISAGNEQAFGPKR